MTSDRAANLDAAPPGAATPAAPELSEPLEVPPLGWQVGPFRVDARALPPAWQAYAAKNYHPATAAAAPALTVRLLEVDPAAYGPQKVMVDKLFITREGADTFRITSPDALDARFDLEQGTLDLRVLAHADAPHLVLGNALRGAVSVALPLRFGGLMFHASSGIHPSGRGVFFPGISTAGKTTLALGFEEVAYLSDDITLTAALDRAPTLSASPFFGIAGRKGANRDAPLAAVGILVRKNPSETLVTRLRPGEAARELMRHAICWSQDVALHGALLARVHDLVGRVPVFAVERFIGDSSDTVMARVLAELDAPGEG